MERVTRVKESDEDSSSSSSISTTKKYRGVRKRKWGKYVSEIRLPNSRERIWLGSYDTAEQAARAFDAALYCLRGAAARFNFPDSPPLIENGRSMSPQEIQAAAARFAHEESSGRFEKVGSGTDDPLPSDGGLDSVSVVPEMPSLDNGIFDGDLGLFPEFNEYTGGGDYNVMASPADNYYYYHWEDYRNYDNNNYYQEINDDVSLWKFQN